MPRYCKFAKKACPLSRTDEPRGEGHWMMSRRRPGPELHVASAFPVCQIPLAITATAGTSNGSIFKRTCVREQKISNQRLFSHTKP